MSRPRRGGPAETVGQVMPRVLRRLGLAGRVSEGRAVAGWPEAVGEAVARRTETLGVRGGTLWVAVENSVWLQELSARRREILRRLAEHGGGASGGSGGTASGGGGIKSGGSAAGARGGGVPSGRAPIRDIRFVLKGTEPVDLGCDGPESDGMRSD